MKIIYWLVLLVIFLIIEFATLGLTTIWFAAGALAAFFSGLLGGDLWVQLIVFFVVSLVLLIATRPFAVKYINKGRTKTNVDSLVGCKAKVKIPINNENATGTVVVNGMEWTARSLNDDITFAEKELVVIKEVSGVKLIVESEENYKGEKE